MPSATTAVDVNETLGVSAAMVRFALDESSWEQIMSVTRRNGVKIVLPRTGADEFWKLVHEHFACADERKWRYLAMLALRENAGWPLDRIGNVFGHPKGHVTRCLARIKQEMRVTFQAEPAFLDLPDDEVQEAAAA